LNGGPAGRRAQQAASLRPAAGATAADADTEGAGHESSGVTTDFRRRGE
jgi:hypothetical protein